MIEVHDDVVLTDVGREKAIALGMRLKTVKTESPPAVQPGRPRSAAAAPASPAASGTPSAEMIGKVKAAVAARLGTHKYDDLLDGIIPQVIAQLNKR